MGLTGTDGCGIVLSPVNRGFFCRAHFTVYAPVPLIRLEHREANGRPHRVAFIARFFRAVSRWVWQ